MSKKVYHLSHTDLDGYGAQLVTLKEFGKENIRFFNSGYGKQIDKNLDTIFSMIKKGDQLIITDLNLTIEQSDKVNFYQELQNFDLVLLDHHGTGKPSAEKYEWYFLDESRCAAKITYDYFKPQDQFLSDIIDIVEANDLWKEDLPDMLEKGKSLSQMIFDSRNVFPKVLAEEEVHMLLHNIYEMGKLLATGHKIPEAENAIYGIQRSYFDPKNELDNPIHVARIHYMYPLILEKDISIPIEINGHKGILFYGLSSIFQEFSHIYLRRNTDIDFVVNVSDQGRMSFRTAKDNVSMSDMCRMYFNGGGHPKASGGSLPESGNQKFSQEEAFASFIEQY